MGLRDLLWSWVNQSALCWVRRRARILPSGLTERLMVFTDARRILLVLLLLGLGSLVHARPLTSQGGVLGTPGTIYTGLVYQYPGSFLVTLADTGSAPRLPRRSYPSVIGVHPCSPAHIAGIEPGDVITGVNDRDGRNAPLFPADVKPQTKHTLHVRRGKKVLSVELRVTTRPVDVPKAVHRTPLGPVAKWDCPSSV